MDNQRQFLSIALVCIVAVLYFKWVEFTAPKPSENQVAQQSDVPGAPAAQITNSDSVPTLPNSSAAGSVSAPQAPSAATTNVAELIEVNTDMVRALINPVGGVIERLELKKQPVSLEQPDQASAMGIFQRRYGNQNFSIQTRRLFSRCGVRHR